LLQGIEDTECTQEREVKANRRSRGPSLHIASGYLSMIKDRQVMPPSGPVIHRLD
jgi:hypothetical protein